MAGTNSKRFQKGVVENPVDLGLVRPDEVTRVARALSQSIEGNATYWRDYTEAAMAAVAAYKDAARAA